MPPRLVLLYFSPAKRPAAAVVATFAERHGYGVVEISGLDELVAYVNRSYPSGIVVDGCTGVEAALEVVRHVKREPFTAVVPVVVYCEHSSEDEVAAALEAGADEVLTSALSPREQALRLRLAQRRAERDVSVHPTTRLPGTAQIERNFAERLRSGAPFAVCYADIDHFKEFNDHYGYHHGDGIILILSRVLRDIVRGHSSEGFVGHIGGDDFIFSVPLEHMRTCCEEIIEVFDELIPLQYSPEDRERGYFLGHDRRGEEYRVPLMTLSIGVVTNQRRTLTHAGQISELATEMKTYAKSLPGSVYAVDRRAG